jgi:hypothetical protein
LDFAQGQRVYPQRAHQLAQKREVDRLADLAERTQLPNRLRKLPRTFAAQAVIAIDSIADEIDEDLRQAAAVATAWRPSSPPAMSALSAAIDGKTQLPSCLQITDLRPDVIVIHAIRHVKPNFGASAGKAGARPKLENSQDPKRTRTVQEFLQRKCAGRSLEGVRPPGRARYADRVGCPALRS